MPARKKNRGLIYLRRSSGRQELSLGGQLTWAIERARQDGVRVDASLDDLAHMQRRGLHEYKDIRLDDSISGANMSRPGFLAVQRDILADRQKSHLYVHMRDRFGRPQDAMQMASIEKSIRESGVTIVLSNDLALPMQAGEGNLGEELKILIEYYMSGDFLRKLSERIIDAQRHVASLGCWTGGNAPYGCVRVLVDAHNNVLEELPRGRTVRQSGCHVQIRPKDESKIRWWMLMLDLSHAKWGSKRIAKLLNDLGVPSPDAGRIRKDRGIPHVNDGQWNHRTVLELLRNPALTGLQRYGRRSMGAHRRLSNEGYRVLSADDKTSNGTPRVIHNDASVQILRSAGFESAYDQTRWQEIQDGINARGKSQKGLPRVRELAKYPLACRIIDMTDDCGSPMYARTVGKRPLYTCGRYMKSGASACKSNSIDAEAMLTFVLRRIEQIAAFPEAAARLREKLEIKLRSRDAATFEDRRDAKRRSAEERHAELVEEQQQLRQNIRHVKNPELIAGLEKDYEVLQRRIRDQEATISSLSQAIRSERSVKDQVEAAMAKLEYLQRISLDPAARSELPQAMGDLGVRAGLVFETKRKGKREVQALRGGVLVFRDERLPIEVFGRDRVNECDGQSECRHQTPPAAKVSGDGTIQMPNGETLSVRNPEHPQKEKAEGVETPSASNSGMDSRPKEGFSSTKGSRGDRI